MRTIAVSVCWLIATVASAQAPLPVNGALEVILADWETAMAKVQSLEASCKRTTIDRVFQTTEVDRGSIRFLRGTGPTPVHRASIHMKKLDNPANFEKLILSGTTVYEFAPSSNEVRVHTLPAPPPGQAVDNNLLSLLMGMKAADAKKLFQMELLKSDDYYHYLRLQPFNKVDFADGRLALLRSSHLPRLVEFVQVNGNRVIWDFEKIDTAAPLVAADFDRPAIPAGWKLNAIPAGGQRAAPGNTPILKKN